MIIKSPLYVWISSRKKFILNLNNYRNLTWHVLNKAKKNYFDLVKDQVLKLPKYKKVETVLTLYPGTRRKTDIANVLSIHDKFFNDVMVTLGKIEDDDYTHVVRTTYKFGEVDKQDPRVDIEIMRVK